MSYVGKTDLQKRNRRFGWRTTGHTSLLVRKQRNGSEARERVAAAWHSGQKAAASGGVGKKELPPRWSPNRAAAFALSWNGIGQAILLRGCGGTGEGKSRRWNVSPRQGMAGTDCSHSKKRKGPRVSALTLRLLPTSLQMPSSLQYRIPRRSASAAASTRQLLFPALPSWLAVFGFLFRRRRGASINLRQPCCFARRASPLPPFHWSFSKVLDSAP